MPIGGSKVGFFGAGVSKENYFGDESLGNCQFGASGITQTSDSTAIDTILATGSEAGGPGTSSYGHAAGGGIAGGVPNSTACYEVTVLNKSGSYDGDMAVLNFIDLTIDSSVTLTTDQPCRGMLVYVSGDCTIEGALSMSCRGGFSDPTVSGGSDSSAVSATGLRLPMLTSGGTDTLAAADFAGSGNAAVTAVAEQPGISGDGDIFKMSQIGSAGASGAPFGTSGAAAPYGANVISTAGGASGYVHPGNTSGTGGDGGAFSGGASSGTCRHFNSSPAGDYGGAGTPGGAGASGEDVAGGSGNPGAPGVYGGPIGRNGVGGIIWLIVKGDLTLTGGSVQGYGAPGGPASYYGGSGTGGGCVYALCGGTRTDVTTQGTIDAQGGAGGSGHRTGHTGGRGGTQQYAVEA